MPKQEKPPVSEVQQRYSVITGSGGGIGKALAEECARRGMNVILVGLPNSGLAQVAEDLTTRYSILAEFREMDLTIDDCPERLADWISRRGLSVDMLINNAGISCMSLFKDSRLRRNEQLVQLNIMATVRLTHLFLPELMRHARSYILNVSSMAAFFPMPFRSVYSSSKAFVLNFTLAIRKELKQSSVRVSVLCPGAVLSSETIREDIATHGIYGRIVSSKTEDIAGKAIAGLLRGQAVIIPGWINKLFRIFAHLLPFWVVQQLIWGRMVRDMPSGDSP